ncbi:hypothetical protein VOM14_13425 [Paraburkholderia sp. MPAMCS5]|uniref:hypothetical protein n=1 Tax=Paraburkholderia sp. MPAMCS5 TaxID=3112563 RepID=UPI002E19C932|nr:hypothetical protein [Paraburkholderia sp. MPAMCS5]
MDAMQRARLDAAAAANAEDASVWRWLSALLEERRVRWRFMFGSWVVHVDRAHVASEPTFYDAIRAAKNASELCGLGLCYEPSPSRRLPSGSSEHEHQTQNRLRHH